MPSPIASDSTKAAASWKRRWSRLLVQGLTCYGVVILVLLLLENYLVFFPATAQRDWFEPSRIGLAVEDVNLVSADGTRLHGWWCPLKDQDHSAKEVVFYCHGNGGNLSHRAYAIQLWQKSLQTPVFIFDYPGYGHSEGKPTEQGCYAAADAAYDWLTQTQGVSPERIILFGESLGGGVAIDLAARKPHRAIVLMGTFTSIPDVAQAKLPFLPARWLVRNQFNSLEKIGNCTRPIFIAHGECDNTVPFALGQRLFAGANEPKHFYRMSDCDHNDWGQPEFWEAVRQFLQKSGIRD